jgi:small-conductance mechanosensitive channel
MQGVGSALTKYRDCRPAAPAITGRQNGAAFAHTGLSIMLIRRGLAAIAWVLLAAWAAALAQTSDLRRLSPEAVADLIASARLDSPAQVVVANRPITVLRASILERSAAARAAAVQQVVAELMADGLALRISSRAIGTAAVIVAGEDDLFVILPADADPLLGETVQSKTTAAVAQLQTAVYEIAEARRPQLMLWAVAQTVLITAVFVVVIALLLRANRWLAATASRTTERRLSKHKVGDEIVRQTRVVLYVKRSANVLLTVLGAVVAYLWMAYVLRRFPYTRPWGESLRALLIDRIAMFGEAAIAALPDLLTIALIVIATRFAVRVAQLIFDAVEEGRLTLMWVYPETAAITRKLVTGLMWLFALVVAYPYVPGSGTDAFKGVSVFVGLVVSLGSGGLVNQIMSGLTLTYSRALRPGDFVRLGDELQGTVVHVGSLSTKIHTPLKEEVTIPNAVMISQCVTNFSRYADTGAFVATEITIGYDAPWRKVEALLLGAAAATAGVRGEPAPYVLQKRLEGSAVRYALMVSLEEQSRRGPILARLHANIQDAFNETGIQIMSPNYENDPERPKLVPKERWNG